MFPIYPTEPIPQHRAIPSIVARYPNDGTHELSGGGAHGTQTYIIHIVHYTCCWKNIKKTYFSGISQGP